MYTICVAVLLFAQCSADITRFKRQDQTWIWPIEKHEKDNKKINETIQLLNEFSTSKPNPENPCHRPPPEKPIFKKPGRRVSEAKCLDYLWNTKARVQIDKNRKDCLQYLLEHPDKDRPYPSFAVGGRDTTPGEFPHMGALGWRTISDTWLFKCGSSLISERYLLTAAHCSKSPPDTNLISNVPGIVRLGDKNIMDVPRSNFQIFDKKILRIINHPKYASPKKYYDIALVELEQPVTFTKFMMPACLWISSSTTDIGKATLTGWGVVDTAQRKTSPELQAAVVDVLESSQCDQLLKSHCNRHWCGMQENQVCAGRLAGGVDACQGDSGGPLQVKIPLPPSTNQSMHYVVGVTSFGIGCGKQNLPGIYTRVSSFLDWIEGVVWPDEL